MPYQIYGHHKRFWLASSSFFGKCAKPHECRRNNEEKCHTAYREVIGVVCGEKCLLIVTYATQCTKSHFISSMLRSLITTLHSRRLSIISIFYKNVPLTMTLAVVLNDIKSFRLRRNESSVELTNIIKM